MSRRISRAIAVLVVLLLHSAPGVGLKILDLAKLNVSRSAFRVWQVVAECEAHGSQLEAGEEIAVSPASDSSKLFNLPSCYVLEVR